MKFRFLFVLLLAGVAAFAQYSQEKIISYHQDITIARDREVMIVEQIKVYAGGEKIKRGIFRDVPLSYSYNGVQYDVSFELVSVKKNGTDELHHEENRENGIRIYVGDKDVYLDPGVYTYQLTYRVNRVLGLFDKYDEIYWNINGNGWDFSIDTVSATLHVPAGMRVISAEAYTGYFGEKGQDYTIVSRADSICYQTTRPLNATENLTVVMAFEKGWVKPLSTQDKLSDFFRKFIYLIVGLLAIFVSITYKFWMWLKHGIDPKAGVIVPQFSPPADISAVDAFYLSNNFSPDKKLFTTALLELATKGYIRITYEKRDTFFAKATFTISRTDHTALRQLIAPELQRFGERLIGSKAEVVLDGEYDESVKNAYEYLTAELAAKHDNKNFVRNNNYKIIAFFIPAIILIGGFIAFYHINSNGWVLLMPAAIILALFFLFNYLIEKPTLEGRKLMDELEGLKMYINYAEKERIAVLNAPALNEKHFEALLPYAQAFGLEKKWYIHFQDTLPESVAYHAVWYSGNFSGFSNAVQTFEKMTTTISSASTPPSQSSGSGGGGFSGGGGGGGGGGGW